jgi:predicted site-specific integrase-resolvase
MQGHYANITSMKKTYSTERVALMVGVHWTSLHRWLRAGKIRPSIAVPIDGRTLWRWTDSDVEKVRKYMADHYVKGRGRKKGH